ncbi:MAG: GerAB/ArcD/ProY family transporter [Clostridia bacterium]|nr:GerAB/ArcD/ProY family transporter [Clostridia bacterium]
MPTEKIPAGEILAALFVSRLLLSFTYISVYGRKTDGGEAAVGALLALLFALACLLPLRPFLRTGDDNILIRAKRISPLLSGGIAAVYVFVFLFAVFAAAMRIEIFTGTVLFSDNRNHWLTMMMLLGASYGAYQGLRAVSRAAIVTAALTASGLILLFFTVGGKIRPENLSFSLRDGISPFLNKAFLSLGGTAELATLPVVVSRCGVGLKKRAPLWLLITFICVSGLAFFDKAVLGSFGETELFPIYALTTQAKIGEDLRLDAMFTAIWLLCALIKMCLYLCVFLQVLRDSYGVRNKAVPLSAAGILCGGAVIALSFDVNSAEIFTSAVPPTLFAVSAAGIPLLVSAAEYVQRKRTVIRKGELP